VVFAILILLALGIYVSKGYNPPFEFIFIWLYENFTPFKIFRRSVSKFYWFVYFLQILLFSIAVIVLWLENNKKRGVIILLLVFLTTFHIATYDKFYPAIYYFDVPKYMKESTEFLKDKTYVYVYIPHDYPTQPIIDNNTFSYSGRDIIDYLWNFRYTRPDISETDLVKTPQKQLANRLYLLIHQPNIDNEDVCELTKKMGLTHFIVRNSLANVDINPKTTEHMLRRFEIFDNIYTFGENENQVIFELKQYCSAGLIISEDYEVNILSTYNKSFFFIEPPEKPVEMVFMSNYNKNWKLSVIKRNVTSIKRNKVATIMAVLGNDIKGKSVSGENNINIVWDLDPISNGMYVLYYKPQLYYYLGLALTTGVFFVYILIGVLKFFHLRKRKSNYRSGR
jgi:hypothetical protein